MTIQESPSSEQVLSGLQTGSGENDFCDIFFKVKSFIRPKSGDWRRILDLGVCIPTPNKPRSTGGIEEFSANENIRKILKVSHFYLGFSPNKNNDEIKHSQSVSLSFLDPNCKNSN